MNKIIINCETGEIVNRALTQEELTQQAIDEQAALEAQAEVEAKVAARQALLDKLGITEEEARLLLGGN